MKKFDIKKLLLLVMSVVLVFAFVACDPDVKKNDDKDKDKDNKPTNEIVMSEYFNTLWTSTKSIGANDIKESDDLKISADLNLGLNVYDKFGVQQSKVEVGVMLSAVLDREDGEDNAFKVQFYDAKKGINNGNVVTLYYFLKEADYGYLDFNGKHIKIGFDTIYNQKTQKVDPDDENSKEINQYANQLHKFLIKNIIHIDGGSTAIYDIINAISSDMGSDWTFNNLVNNIIKALNLENSIRGLLESKKDLVAQVLGMEPNEVMNEDGEINLGKILQSPTLATFFKGATLDKDSNVAGRKIYTTTIDWEMVSPILGIIKLDTMGMIDTATETSIKFATKDNKFDGAEIVYGMKHIVLSGAKYYPSISVKINDIKIDKIDNTNIESVRSYMNMSSIESYTDTYNAELEVSLNGMAGIVIPKEVAKTDEDIDLSSNLDLKINACIDLLNPQNTNKTRLFGTLKNGDKQIAELEFKIVDENNPDSKGIVILKVDDSVNIPNTDVSYVKLFVNIFGEMIVEKFTNPDIKAVLKNALFSEYTNESKVYNEAFEGIVITDVDMPTLLRNGVKTYLDKKHKDETAKNSAVTTDLNAGENQIKKFEEGYYPSAQDENKYLDAKKPIVCVAPNLKSIGTLFASSFDAEGNKISLSFNNLIAAANTVLTNGKYKYYLKNDKGEFSTQKEFKFESESFANNKEFLAYIVANIEGDTLIQTCTNLGIIELFNLDGVDYYKNINMLTKSEMIKMYEYLIGEKSYADYQTDVEDSAVSEAEYNNAFTFKKFHTVRMVKVISTFAFASDNDDNYKLIEKLFSTALDVEVNIDNGLGLNAVLNNGNNTKLELSANIKLVDGQVDVPKITIPVFDSAKDNEYKTGWGKFAITIKE